MSLQEKDQSTGFVIVYRSLKFVRSSHIFWQRPFPCPKNALLSKLTLKKIIGYINKVTIPLCYVTFEM